MFRVRGSLWVIQIVLIHTDCIFIAGEWLSSVQYIIPAHLLVSCFIHLNEDHLITSTFKQLKQLNNGMFRVRGSLWVIQIVLIHSYIFVVDSPSNYFFHTPCFGLAWFGYGA
jgi:hypothetical protein